MPWSEFVRIEKAIRDAEAIGIGGHRKHAQFDAQLAHGDFDELRLAAM